MAKRVNTSTWKVRKRQCATCPFREDVNGRSVDPELRGKVEARVLTEASQICHHPVLYGKKEFELCRGARNFQLMFFHRIGFLDAPTDEAWEAKRKK